MDNCIFCKIASGEIPSAKVYEDDKYVAFLDINPVNKGHTLVIPKEHYEDITRLPSNLNHSYMDVIKKVGLAVQQSLDLEGFNIIINTGKPAGQVIYHVHCHIIPRVDGDGFEQWKGNPYVSNEEVESYTKTISGFIR